MTEVFRLLGRIAIEGADEAKETVENVVKSVQLGSSRVCEAAESINKIRLSPKTDSKAEMPYADNGVSVKDTMQSVLETARDLKETLSGGMGTDAFGKFSENANKAFGTAERLKRKLFEGTDSDMFGGLSESAGKAFGIAERLKRKLFEGTDRDMFGGLSESAGKAFGIAEKLKRKLFEETDSDMFGGLSENAERASQEITDKFSPAEKIRGQMKLTEKYISDGVSKAQSIQSGGLERIMRSSYKKWEDIGGTAARGTLKMSESILSGISAVQKSCSTVSSAAENALKADGSYAGAYLMDTFKSGITSRIQSVYSAALSAAQAVSNAVSQVSFSIGGSFKGSRLPRHAQGGIVTREHIATVGEEGAEAILPLENHTGWMDGLAERLGKNTPGNDEVIEKLDELCERMGSMKIYLDGDRLVGELAPKIDSSLGRISRYKRRGL